MRPGVSHLGGCVTARGPAQGPHLILRLILGASPGVCSELFREEPHSPLLSWDRERCRRSWKIEVIVTEPLLWQEHSCEDSFILVMNKRWEVSCSGIGTSTPDSADDCVDRWQLSASVFLAEQLGSTQFSTMCRIQLYENKRAQRQTGEERSRQLANEEMTNYSLWIKSILMLVLTLATSREELTHWKIP
ncbi:uncharacterized protein LOC129636178 isoform X7 [Bubalus kerabau]|uniref:uncharacterized protein LOC129636178 isoform X7 n=1 Tax=Bubalus carabanensis TaxID=3119969 RepID=UPI00244E99E6|nr:uncharacterized protein LOC129636178 isoform X7 [Bubalus carabanensis]